MNGEEEIYKCKLCNEDPHPQMMQCMCCEHWFHWECVDVNEEEAEEGWWLCNDCHSWIYGSQETSSDSDSPDESEKTPSNRSKDTTSRESRGSSKRTSSESSGPENTSSPEPIVDANIENQSARQRYESSTSSRVSKHTQPQFLSTIVDISCHSSIVRPFGHQNIESASKSRESLIVSAPGASKERQSPNLRPLGHQNIGPALKSRKKPMNGQPSMVSAPGASNSQIMTSTNINQSHMERLANSQAAILQYERSTDANIVSERLVDVNQMQGQNCYINVQQETVVLARNNPARNQQFSTKITAEVVVRQIIKPTNLGTPTIFDDAQIGARRETMTTNSTNVISVSVPTDKRVISALEGDPMVESDCFNRIFDDLPINRAKHESSPIMDRPDSEPKQMNDSVNEMAHQQQSTTHSNQSSKEMFANASTANVQGGSSGKVVTSVVINKSDLASQSDKRRVLLKRMNKIRSQRGFQPITLGMYIGTSRPRKQENAAGLSNEIQTVVSQQRQPSQRSQMANANNHLPTANIHRIECNRTFATSTQPVVMTIRPYDASLDVDLHQTTVMSTSASIYQQPNALTYNFIPMSGLTGMPNRTYANGHSYQRLNDKQFDGIGVTKWQKQVEPISASNLGLVIYERNPRITYPIARVLGTRIGSNKQVRRARVELIAEAKIGKDGKISKVRKTHMWRPAHKLAVLDVLSQPEVSFAKPEIDRKTGGRMLKTNVNTELRRSARIAQKSGNTRSD